MIRPYRPDTDYNAILAIYADSFPGYTRGALDERLKTCKTWVHTRDGKGTGYGQVLAYIILEGSYLSQIAVHKDYRGRGIARRLIRYAENHCSLDSPVIWLQVRKDNPAFLLYERLGYKVKELVSNLYGYGYDGYVMEKMF